LFTEKHIMSLPEKTRRELRARGHTLKPVVSIGNAGLSEAVLRELELSIEHHELMKVRIGGAEREQRRQMIAAICEQLGAELVQAVGHIALIYRKRKEQAAAT
jgi:RNA-binding protein